MAEILPDEFRPEDNAITCDPGNNPITAIWIGESNLPGNNYIAKGKKPCIHFRKGSDHIVNIYFDIDDAKSFKDMVKQSLEERKPKGFNPKNTVLNPGEHSIDHILTGFPPHKEKGSWRIILHR